MGIPGKFNFLIANQVSGFDTGEIDFLQLSKYKDFIADSDYFEFIIESENGGFFFSRSLQLYSFSSSHDFNDIQGINSILIQEYGKIVDDLVSFGQDIFGMQFCFKKGQKDVYTFNPETGECDLIASSFLDWINLLDKELAYMTGINALEEWLSKNNLNFNQRLCPRTPFVMGGGYKIDNLYAASFPDYFQAYANIARQIYNLPDGTNVKIVIRRKYN